MIDSGLSIRDGLIVSEAGCCLSVCQHASPFYNERPESTPIDALVIHNISLPAGVFHGTCVNDLFLGCLDVAQDESLADLDGVEVSAHLFIRRNGEVHQFVPFHQRAWHAGVSSYEVNGVLREAWNDFSIGIEIEGLDDIPYTFRQYQSLIQVTQLLLKTYPIMLNDVVGHNDIAPGRKTDPGMAFDWSYFKAHLAMC
ncbi:MAG: 1,6-anhydro-N-acetylmuramyl-L-alanine amidase AmpD [Pseudomonadota bacterium]